MNNPEENRLHLASERPAGPEPRTTMRDTSGQDVAVAPEHPRRRRYIAAGTAAAVVALVLIAYPIVNRWLQAEVTVPLDRIRTAVVTRGDFVRDVGVQGVVVAAVSPTLFAAAPGRVTLEIQAGATVAEGDVLARIDSPDLTSELQQEVATLQSLQSDLDRQRIELKSRQLENQQTIDLARVRITAAERELRRAETAHAASAISLQDYEKANDDVDTARLEFTHAQQNAELQKEVMEFEIRTGQLAVDRQQLMVDNLRRRVAALEVRSPVTGIVGNLMVEQKAAVAENQPLLAVVDLSAFEIEIQVPESYSDDLAIGMQADVSYGGRTVEGILTAVSPEVQNNQVTGRVRFAGETPDGLRQNQRVSVRIVLESSDDVLIVRRGQFLDSGGGRIAYVLSDGIAERRAITVGATSINSLQIASGLQEGETIIVSDIGQFNGADTVYVTD